MANNVRPMRRGPTTRPFDSGWDTCFQTLEVHEVQSILRTLYTGAWIFQRPALASTSHSRLGLE